MVVIDVFPVRSEIRQQPRQFYSFYRNGCSIAYTSAGFVLGVPGSTRRYLADRKFVAVRKDSKLPCGQVAVGENGTSFGYTTFLRMVGADAGDVLLAEFDLAGERVELSLVDEVVLESDVSDS